eukprot:8547549-Pyramimonas_sp.AAC.1
MKGRKALTAAAKKKATGATAAAKLAVVCRPTQGLQGRDRGRKTNDRHGSKCTDQAQAHSGLPGKRPKQKKNDRHGSKCPDQVQAHSGQGLHAGKRQRQNNKTIVTDPNVPIKRRPTQGLQGKDRSRRKKRSSRIQMFRS